MLKIFFAALGGNLVLYSILNFVYSLLGNLWYCVACVAVIIISVVVFLRYWKWYKEQQAELLRKKQEYAKYLKQTGGNVVNVKPSETDTESSKEISEDTK